MRSDILHRTPLDPPPLARKGTGHLIVPAENVSTKPIMDLSCGAAVTGLGLSNLHVKGAIQYQISNLPYCHSAQWTHPTIEEAGTVILEACTVTDSDGTTGNLFKGGGVTFFSGGAEGIEAAVKIAMQYQSALNPMGLPVQIVGRDHSYHGNSMFTLALGDHPRKQALKAAFNLTPHIERIEAFAPDIFGGMNEDERRAHVAASLRSLEAVLQRNAHAKRRCIVVIETIGGTTIGIAPPVLAYLIGVRKLCDEFETTLIYDEILCANFRTGKMAAWQYYQSQSPYNVVPDIFVMGKGITAGYFPMSAVVVRQDIRVVLEGEGKVWHTSTNQNHVVGCAALVAAFESYRTMIDRVEILGTHITFEIAPDLREFPGIVAVVGLGCLWGVQFSPTIPGLHLSVKKELLERNCSVYSDGGTIQGKGNMIMFAPAYTMTLPDLNHACFMIKGATRAAINRHS